MTGFNICSFNLGGNDEDAKVNRRYQKADFNISSAEENRAFLDSVRVAETASAGIVSANAAVLLLQEVASNRREFITGLPEHYQLYHHTNRLDCAIAIDTRLFNNIQNHSQVIQINNHFSKTVAVITATEIATGKRYTFAAAHVPGFAYNDPTADTSEGDRYFQGVANRVASVGKGSIQVVGADMNASPWIDNHKNRFSIVTRLKFKIFGSGSPTNLNVRDTQNRAREIDFFFVKVHKTFWQKICSLFRKSTQFNPVRDNPVGWDYTRNASDHLPIFLNVR